MAGQEHEDIEFLWSQPQFLTVQVHGSLVKIDPEITEFDPLGQGSTLLGRLSLGLSAPSLGYYLPQTPASGHLSPLVIVVPSARPLHVSNPIQLHPALRNSALSLPALWRLRPIPVRPDEPQLPGGFFPVVAPVPTPQRLAGSHSQNLARSPGDNGVRALPIVPRILLGSTSETTLSRLINLGLSLLRLESSPHSTRSHAARVTGFFRC